MDDTLAEDLRQAIGDLVRAARAADTMPAGEAAILGHLDRGGPQTTADLAQRRGVTHQSTAKSVKQLAAEGLVRAEPHATDGRKLVIHITEKGKARLDEERAQRADWLDAAIRSTLSATEQRQIQDCIPLLVRLTTSITSR
jgi:DNA-binding MarR family transcriptional regulator